MCPDGRFNRGAQFGPGEGGHVDRTESDDTPPPAVNLTWKAPCIKLSRNSQAHLVRAVRDNGAADLLHAGKRAAGCAGEVGELAEIPMSTGNGDHGAGGIDARAFDDAQVDGALETEHRPPTSRTVVKPRISMLGCLHRQPGVVEADVTERLCREVTRASIACQCASNWPASRVVRTAIDDGGPTDGRDGRWRCARSPLTDRHRSMARENSALPFEVRLAAGTT